MNITNKDSVQGFLRDTLEVTVEWAVICGLGAAAAEIAKEATAQLAAKDAEIARLRDIAEKAERFILSDGGSATLYYELRRCFVDDK